MIRFGLIFFALVLALYGLLALLFRLADAFEHRRIVRREMAERLRRTGEQLRAHDERTMERLWNDEARRRDESNGTLRGQPRVKT